MLKFQFWRSGKCTIHFHCHYSQAPFSQEWWCLSGSKTGVKQICLKFSLFNSNVKLVTVVEDDQKVSLGEGAQLLSQDCSTLPLIRTLYCWVLSKEVSSTIFKAFGMTRPGIEPRSLGPLANTLPSRPIQLYSVEKTS